MTSALLSVSRLPGGEWKGTWATMMENGLDKWKMTWHLGLYEGIEPPLVGEKCCRLQCLEVSDSRIYTRCCFFSVPKP